MVLVVKNPPANAGDRKICRFDPWVQKVPWRRKWQPAPVFLPGEYHGQRSLAGCIGLQSQTRLKQLSMHTHKHIVEIVKDRNVQPMFNYHPGQETKCCLHPPETPVSFPVTLSSLPTPGVKTASFTYKLITFLLSLSFYHLFMHRASEILKFSIILVCLWFLFWALVVKI